MELTPAILQSPFIAQLHADELAKAEGRDLEHYAPIGAALWNLACTKRDLHMWANLGIKPHRHWKVRDVKAYFGITGTRHTLLARFLELHEAVTSGALIHLEPST